LVGPKFCPLSMHSFMQPLQYFHIISSVDCLASRNKQINNALEIEESDEYCLHLWFRHPTLFEPSVPFRNT
jgi:hypothetical protein